MTPEPVTPVTPAATAAVAAAARPAIYKDEIGLKEAAVLIKLSEQRLRSLLTAGKVPETVAKKNIASFWRFSKTALQEWFVNRPKGVRTGGGGGRKDGSKTFKVTLLPAQVEAINKVMPDVVLKPAFNYKPEKAKAYRLERAKKLAAEAAAKTAAGAPKTVAGH